MNIAIFLPNWIGDVVMATPTLRAVRNWAPAGSRLWGVMRPYVADVLAGTSWLDEQVFYDPRAKDKQLGGRALIKHLRAANLDAAVLLTNSLRTAWLAWRSGASRRVGYVRGGRGLLLTDRLYPQREAGRYVPSPVLDYYLELAYHLGAPPESPQMELATLPRDEAAADALWQQFGFAEDRPVVALNVGAAFGAAKLWPAEYFALLARRLAEHGYDVLTLCGPSEREIARRIETLAGHDRVRSLADAELSLGLTKACVRRSRLLVTTDSGPRHFAAALDVPVVTLFGPTHIAWSETHYPRAAHLQVEVPCGPCQQRVCPLGHHRCMRDLSVDQVFATTLKQLERTQNRQAA